MIFEATGINGLWQLRLQPQGDARGSFARTFDQASFAAHGLADRFVQMSSSRTAATGTIRGMHQQAAPYEEAKLVRCVRGAIHDIVCDMRPNSPTYLCSRAFCLDQDGYCAIYIPPGCAHGFQTLRDDVEVVYAMTTVYMPEAAIGYRFDDPLLALHWPLPVGCVSEKDLAWPDCIDARQYMAPHSASPATVVSK